MTIAVKGGLATGVYYEAAAVTLLYLLGAGNRNASKTVLEKKCYDAIRNQIEELTKDSVQSNITIASGIVRPAIPEEVDVSRFDVT